MELDELKSVLKSKLEADSATRSAGELEQYVKGRTTSILDRIKRNMIFEFVFGGVAIVILIWAFWKYPQIYFRYSCGLAVLFNISILLYMMSLYNKINFFKKTSFSVRESLVQIIAILKKFTRLYFQLSMFMLLVAFILGLVTGYMDVIDQGLAKSFHWTRGLLFYIGFFLFWSIIMYFFLHWYIKKLYGKYLEQLKDQLRDLENG